jgi:hypothetical protein
MNINQANPGRDAFHRVPFFQPRQMNDSRFKSAMRWKSASLTASLLALLGTAVSASGQSFAIDWFTIDGGGGTSTGSVYAVSGTIGQPDVGRLTGANYTLVGGFWSVIPQDSIRRLKIKKRAGQLVLSWPADATGVVVQSATQLAPGGGNWANFAGDPVRVGDEFELVIGPAITPPNPIRFFRLTRP